MIKKVFFLFLIVFSYGITFCQSKKFSLTGRISGLDSGEVLILNRDEELKFTSNRVNVKNGEFNFSGFILHPSMISIHIINPSDLRGKSSYFFIDSGNQHFSSSLDSFYAINPTIEGSKTNLEYTGNYKILFETLDRFTDDWNKSYASKESQYQNNIPVVVEDSFRNARQNLYKAGDDLLFNYIKKNPNSYVGLDNLFIALNRGYRSIYDSSFNLLSHKLKNTFLGKLIKITLESSTNTKINSIFPSIESMDLNNRPVKLSASDNTFTLIDFWFYHCPSCLDQFAKLSALYKRFKPKGFQIIGISNDPVSQDMNLKNLIRRYKLPWLQWRDKSKLLCEQLAIHNFPTNFLLDSKGKVIAKNIEPSQLKAFLEKNLSSN